MTYAFDLGRGMPVGSHIRMGGTAFGVSLSVDEVVVVREPPFRKSWQTVGETHLLVLKSYSMGFEIGPEASGSRLRVWIDYELPTSFAPSILGFLFGAIYARWCVNRMARDAAHHFNKRAP